MNRQKQTRRLLSAIGDIDDRFLLDAMAEIPAGQQSQKRKSYLRWGLAAACLTLVVAGKMLLLPSGGSVSSGFGETAEETAENADAAESPFEEVESMEKAAAITDFTLDAPEEDALTDGPAITNRVITVLDGTMIEVSYQTENGEEVWAIRKAPGEEDISGDYEEYSAVEIITAGTREVTLKGDGETVSVALWQENGYAYALCAENYPLTEEKITVLIGVIDP